MAASRTPTPSAPPLPFGLRELVLVAAVGSNGALGRRGALPWHLPEDLRHFRTVTRGHVVLMGRRTWTSLPGVLPERHHIVLSRDPTLRLPPGVERATSLQDALQRAAARDPAPRVVGGAEVYRATLPLATTLWLTEVDIHVPDADTFFPPYDAEAFIEVERRGGRDPRLTFRRRVRRPATGGHASPRSSR